MNMKEHHIFDSTQGATDKDIFKSPSPYSVCVGTRQCYAIHPSFRESEGWEECQHLQKLYNILSTCDNTFYL